MKIVAKSVDGGATVAFFPASRAAAQALKASFGEAVSFRPDDKAWFMAGPDARALLSDWAAENKAAVEAAAKAARAAPRIALDAMSDADLSEALALADASPIASPLVVRSADRAEWLVQTPYRPEIVEAMREGVLGAKFDRAAGAWRVPVTSTESLRSEIAGIERAAALAPTSEPRPDTRWLGLLSDAPETGQPMSRDDAVVVPVLVGKAFPANKSTLRDHPQLAGHLGEDVAYVYYREATPEEAEEFDSSSAPTP